MLAPNSDLCFLQARLVPLLLHARSARERQREAQSEVCRIFPALSGARAPTSCLNLLFPPLLPQPASREKQQHGEPAGERRLAAHARLRPDRPSAGAESCADPPTSLQHGRLWYTGASVCVNTRFRV